jgi:predicted secreted protein
MPPSLVFATISRLSIDLAAVRPADVYRLARDMHSSYEATARHLTNLQLMTGADRDVLLATTRAGAKAQLTRGRAPAGEVWDVGPANAGDVVLVAPGDEVFVELPESPSTGYVWTLPYEVEQPLRAAPPPPLSGDCPPLEEVAEPESTPASQRQVALQALQPPTSRRAMPASSAEGAFRVVADVYLPSWASIAETRRPDTTRRRRLASSRHDATSADEAAPVVALQTHLGGVGTRLLALRANSAGSWRIQLDYNRPFEPDSSQGTFEVLARVLVPDPQPYDITDGVTDDSASASAQGESVQTPELESWPSDGEVLPDDGSGTGAQG